MESTFVTIFLSWTEIETIQLRKKGDKREKFHKSLSIFCVIDDYNKHMCGADLLSFFLPFLNFKLSHKDGTFTCFGTSC